MPHDLDSGEQVRHENLFHIDPEARAVDGAIEEPGCLDAVMAQGRQEGQGAPFAVRDLCFQPLATRRPSPERRHVGLGPGLVDEDQALRRDAPAVLLPLGPPAFDVRAIPFTGDGGFF